MTKPRPIDERLWECVQFGGPSDCWLWKGAVHRDGYGVIGTGGRSGGQALVHRVVFSLAFGSPAYKSPIRQMCGVALCVNPAHLRSAKGQPTDYLPGFSISLSLPPPPGYRHCTVCDALRPETDFPSDMSKPGGLDSRCRECHAEKFARYYASNRRAVLAYRQAYNVRNREQYRENQRRTYRRHRERRIANVRKRGVRLRATRALYGYHTEQEWQAKLAEFGGRCAHCGSTENISRDHIVPLARGGTDLIENIQPLCLPCNGRKGAKV